jgi:hypothetical protein
LVVLGLELKASRLLSRHLPLEPLYLIVDFDETKNFSSLKAHVTRMKGYAE